MAEKISPDALLSVAVQLFIAIPKNKIDQIDSSPMEEKRERQIENFVKFYRQLRDKLEADAE